MTPPERLSSATFDTYRPKTESQRKGKKIVEAFVEQQQSPSPWWDRAASFLGRKATKPKGVYLVGPVGTGKSHLLASAYNALEPHTSCNFVHMSTITRLTINPREFANMLATASDVVCIDELEIDDAANEARLVTILTILEEKKISLLASSNVTPSGFMANKLGTGRFTTFLDNHFRESYQIAWMEGEDFRATQESSGYAWVGSSERTSEKMRAHYTYRKDDACWLEFNAFIKRSESTPHKQLTEELAAYDALYLSGIEINSTDDALRLLRVVDDLYTTSQPPDLYFTSTTHPDEWLTQKQNGAAQPVSTKFKRTISRIKAMCTIECIGAASITQ